MRDVVFFGFRISIPQLRRRGPKEGPVSGLYLQKACNRREGRVKFSICSMARTKSYA